MDQTLRLVEREILDKEYTRFKILHREQYLAIGHLLKIAGDYWRDERLAQDTARISAQTRLAMMLGGLGHCIRWVTKAHNRRIRLPKATWQELDREALEFLIWGMEYHRLSADHIVWSRNMLQANLDVTNKVIKFSTFSIFDSAFLLAQHSDDQRALETLHNALPIQELQWDFERWRRHFKVVDGGFNFAEDAVRQLASYPAVLHWLETGVLPGVQANEDLGGYSLDEFRRFFAALFMNCNFWTWVEDGFDELFGA